MHCDSLRSIPSVHQIVSSIEVSDFPRPIIVRCVRDTLGRLRKGRKSPTYDNIISLVLKNLEVLRYSKMQPVINGTGILVHTNLGRAPLGHDAVRALVDVSHQYCNLEYDLRSGTRGKRSEYLEYALAILCKAEAATVVNNNAASLVLILQHLCGGKHPQVIVSRGELIQIGGGFRIPEILVTSGAELVEVGTTNRTSLVDYEQAIGRRTGIILKVHQSNFFMEGFVSLPTTKELVALAKRKRIPFVEDLGSGAIVSTDKYADVNHEPTPIELIKCGVHLVCFSGDKLLGGPQAGIIVGRRSLVRGLKQDPLYRALRCDKLILAGLQRVVESYLEGCSLDTQRNEIPIITMLATSVESLQSRAEVLIKGFVSDTFEVKIRKSEARIGGGALPSSPIPSIALEIKPHSGSAKAFAAKLRQLQPAIIGYISGNTFHLDLRTIFPAQDNQLMEALNKAVEV